MASKYYYQQEISNEYLGKSKLLKAESPRELEKKINEQISKWKIQEEKTKEKERIDNLKDKADFDTKEALDKISEFNSILSQSLNTNYKINWDDKKNNEEYSDFSFTTPEPILNDIINEMNVPKKSFLEILIKSLKTRREDLESKAKIKFESELDNYNKQKQKAYDQYVKDKDDFIFKRDEENKEIETWKSNFESGDKEAVEEYINFVLENSSYPDEIDKEFEIQYIPETKILVTSYKLPCPDNIPKIIEYKYIKTRDIITTKEMKKADFEKFYEDIIYQITLRTLHEIFDSLYIQHVSAIVFNGWVEYIDPATGNDVNSCIISLQVDKDDFIKINLNRVDFKECIRSLKGLFAGKLITLAPVKPLLEISKEDSRFIESKDVLSKLNSSSNLAAMHWDDFEHLVRQLFEKMFTSDGADVKVTQASRDGGVDAIAFDPDPIKGGKFVIQAKRYNIVVPVSAVRDLYGTMIHEGATKGILVTTSHFGKDSYEFVKDKPISLIDGNNLLSLFSQYGYENLSIVLNK